MVLIIVLLVRAFKSLKNILLIVLSVSWGWLFAFGILSLVHDSISVIVIGISSVILGIAVNYPLHFVSHLYHTPDVKTALKELVVPLVVGNITTVGAFAALVPADSAALRDLGLFSALLLVGTIVFVLVFMPHFAVAKTENTVRKKIFPDFSPEKSRITVGAVLILTPVLLYFSFNVKFDADFSHINYMTETQKNALKKLQNIIPEVSAAQNVYAVSTGKTFDEAYTNSAEISSQISSLNADKVLSCRTFLTDSQTQKHRLEKWSAFVSGYFSSLKSQIETAAQKEGFAEGTFDDFFQILKNDYPEKKVEEFAPLTKSVFRQNVIFDTLKNECSIIDILSSKEKNFTEKAAEKLDGVYVFDVKSLNSQVAKNLSDDFNYIGWACSLIVFCFLWFSFGSIELALLSFLPMAVSWIWILGLMSLFDIQFNLVNIILATFIFGQGDDYTIFITEGCQREYALRKKMLPAYKESIMTSALIMFAGIGVLIFAKHPALFSLAEVTIAGMFSVVLTAYIFPPLIFRFLTSRQRPLTLKSLFFKRNSPLDIVLDVYRYRGIEIFSPAKKRLKSFITPVTDKQVIAVKNCKTGEIPLFLALMFPEKKILGFDLEKENLSIAEIAAENIADNVSFFSEKDFEKVIKGLSENDAEIIEIV
jgi:predicted RND superfamily exporter protein